MCQLTSHTLDNLTNGCLSNNKVVCTCSDQTFKVLIWYWFYCLKMCQNASNHQWTTVRCTSIWKLCFLTVSILYWIETSIWFLFIISTTSCYGYSPLVKCWCWHNFFRNQFPECQVKLIIWLSQQDTPLDSLLFLKSFIDLKNI